MRKKHYSPAGMALGSTRLGTGCGSAVTRLLTSQGRSQNPPSWRLWWCTMCHQGAYGGPSQTSHKASSNSASTDIPTPNPKSVPSMVLLTLLRLTGWNQSEMAAILFPFYKSPREPNEVGALKSSSKKSASSSSRPLNIYKVQSSLLHLFYT